MKKFLLKIFVIFLSLFLLGACAGKQEFQKKEKGGASVPLAPRKLQKTQGKTLSSNPLAYYHFLLSQFKLKEGKVDEAMEDLKEAIARDIREPSLHVELATLYIHKGLLNEAIEECKNGLLYDPDHLPAHLLLGGIYSILKKTPLAIAAYEKVLEINPLHRESYLFLSSLYEDLQKYDQAINLLKQFP
jgi:tetratricopeptide (TPR) repeat protein